MNAPSRHRRSFLFTAILLPLLGGCGGLLPKPPERKLYRLAPVLDAVRRGQQVNVTLLVATPSALSGIDSKRIALTPSAVSLDYFADAEWIDRPSFLLREALVDGLEKSRSFAGVSTEGLGLNADFVLDTEIQDFSAIYDSPNQPPRIRVKLDVELVTMRGRNIVAETSLTREAAAEADNLPAIIAAFNQAVGAIVADLATWTATSAASAAKRK
jgi:cholesterol transport system auxiliary component